VVFQIIALALALTSFTGCGGDSTSSDKVDSSNANGVYVSFGRAMGYMQNTWVDVHGAGAQRSDPKAGDPNDYPTGKGPQGDAIRIYNYVRLVRDAGSAVDFAVVDSGQTKCYSNINAEITCPAAGEALFGQDAQHTGNASSFIDNGNGTVTDNITGLMWQQSPDTDGVGDIDADDKLSYDEAVAGASTLNLGGYSDWRLPTIKELYSLIDFSGTDPSGYEGSDTSGLIPFIDAAYFDFAYGDTSAGERIIDAQYASITLYVSNTANDGGRTMFGVNFADGRIKGYGLTRLGSDTTFFVIYVRGNTSYGQNDFTENGDGTITDSATGLMWTQDDSAIGLNWEEALAWVVQMNAADYLGFSDWRLPNAKELQSIVDYTRSPDTTSSAAIDPLFNVTSITNEAGQSDFPAYWSSTTHVNWITT
jgi:hypothetical protein